MTTETIKIDGMSCEKCQARVQKIILAADGVIDAKVSLEAKNAVVEYDTEKTTIEQIKKAVRDAGYTA